MATHREAELRDAARTLAAVARAHGFDPRARHDGVLAALDRGSRTTRGSGAFAPSRPAGPASRTAASRAPPPAPPAGGVFDFEAPEPIRRAA